MGCASGKSVNVKQQSVVAVSLKGEHLDEEIKRTQQQVTKEMLSAKQTEEWQGEQQYQQQKEQDKQFTEVKVHAKEQQQLNEQVQGKGEENTEVVMVNAVKHPEQQQRSYGAAEASTKIVPFQATTVEEGWNRTESDVDEGVHSFVVNQFEYQMNRVGNIHSAQLDQQMHEGEVNEGQSQQLQQSQQTKQQHQEYQGKKSEGKTDQQKAVVVVSVNWSEQNYATLLQKQCELLIQNGQYASVLKLIEESPQEMQAELFDMKVEMLLLTQKIVEAIQLVKYQLLQVKSISDNQVYLYGHLVQNLLENGVMNIADAKKEVQEAFEEKVRAKMSVDSLIVLANLCARIDLVDMANQILRPLKEKSWLARQAAAFAVQENKKEIDAQQLKKAVEMLENQATADHGNSEQQQDMKEMNLKMMRLIIK